ncbi:MAG TPA: HAD family phosphatase, partial [Candidatus Limnocylindria bacterium]|nr:HAD family phosphatase [Candidatus Limnocylindria bacterium]
VIFDFGGVIHSFDFGMFFRSLGGSTDRSFGEVSSLVAGSGLPRRYELGEISSREFYRGIANLCGLRVTEEEFVQAFVAIFTPIEPTICLIRSLSPSYRLGLLSNTNEWHFEHHIRTVEIFSLFDAVTLSFQVRSLKPAEAIYLDMLEKIGFPPEECVFVDDLEENVAGARRLDLHAIHYTGHEKLVSSLAELGVVAGQDVGK